MLQSAGATQTMNGMNIPRASHLENLVLLETLLMKTGPNKVNLMRLESVMVLLQFQTDGKHGVIDTKMPSLPRSTVNTNAHILLSKCMTG